MWHHKNVIDRGKTTLLPSWKYAPRTFYNGTIDSDGDGDTRNRFCRVVVVVLAVAAKDSSALPLDFLSAARDVS